MARFHIDINITPNVSRLGLAICAPGETTWSSRDRFESRFNEYITDACDELVAAIRRYYSTPRPSLPRHPLDRLQTFRDGGITNGRTDTF